MKKHATRRKGAEQEARIPLAEAKAVRLKVSSSSGHCRR